MFLCAYCSELLYSSLDAHHELQNRGSAGAVQLPPEPEEASTSDANSYQAFRAVDEEIAKRIQESQVTVSGEETDLQAWQDSKCDIPMPPFHCATYNVDVLITTA